MLFTMSLIVATGALDSFTMWRTTASLKNSSSMGPLAITSTFINQWWLMPNHFHIALRTLDMILGSDTQLALLLKKSTRAIAAPFC